MENRPTLADPSEFATIKKIYFKDDGIKFNEDLDEIERLQRMESRQKHNRKSSR
jgi:hypothetical protein